MQPTVLVVEDEPALRDALIHTLDAAGYKVAGASDGREALDVISDRDVSMVISDIQMKPMNGKDLLGHIKSRHPKIPVLLMTAFGSIQQAVETLQGGAVDYLVKPFEADVLIDTVSRYLTPIHERSDQLHSSDEATNKIYGMAARVADTDVTVLITGESGVGKEVLARYIHNQSIRVEQPFIAINCAAIPDNMLEATLFGYEKGAFTGAYQSSPGKFEQAQGGTLLLDEISEMDLGLQAKLLRVLQEKEVERLGGRKMIDLDVRVLATSNRNLKNEVIAGRFREDLFYRLNVFPLRLPPLRQRKADILTLSKSILATIARDQGRPLPLLSPAAEQTLLAHDWPGNIRELGNVLQRALILQCGDTVSAEDIQIEPKGEVDSDERCTGRDEQVSTWGEPNEDLKAYQQKKILQTLEAVQGNRKRAAERLGISQRTLRYKIAQMRAAGMVIPRSYGAETA